MEPITLALSLLLKSPMASSAADMAHRAAAPGMVDVAKMQTSVADLARGILTCYHKTARFHATDVADGAWNRQDQYGAENSAVMRIQYSGLTGGRYQMVVAVMAKQNQVRTAVLTDTATVPYNKKCALEEWTGA